MGPAVAPLPFHRRALETPTYQDHHGHWQGWWDNLQLAATFTHRTTGAKICITEIWIDDDGKILQYGSNYGDLTLPPPASPAAN